MVATSVFNAIPGTAKELCDFKDFHYDREAKFISSASGPTAEAVISAY